MDFRFSGRTLLLVIAVACSLPASADALLDQAQRLLDGNQAGQAYTLLLQQYDQRTGTPDYDLLLGIAALESGHPTRAVFALERVLAVQPDNARARAELARAYYQMGENEAARQEFTAVRKQSVPASVARGIDKYLSEIDARLAATKRRVNVYVEAQAGYDSNTNSATDTSTIAIPAFGNLIFTLDNTGRSQDSGFFALGAGMSFSSPISNDESLRVFGSADIQERVPVDAGGFRTRLANGQAGLNYNIDTENTIQGSVVGQKYYLGGEPNRDLAGVNLQWLHSFDNRTQFSTYARYAIQRFPGQRLRDVNQTSGGVGMVHQFAAQGDPVVFASLFGGMDDETHGSRPDIGRVFAGIRAGGEYRWNRNTTLVGNIGYQYSRYGADDPLFLKRRRDHFVFVRAGVEYTLAKNWMVRPEIQYIVNNSTLPINDFNRWLPFVTLRAQF